MGNEQLNLNSILTCDYCSFQMDENSWQGHFEGEHEYMIQKCGDCCRNKWVKIGLDGFDPRDWMKRQESEVEPAISKKVYEKE